MYTETLYPRITLNWWNNGLYVIDPFKQVYIDVVLQNARWANHTY